MEQINQIYLTKKATDYLNHLCLELPNRRVGSRGNQEATDFFAGIVSSYGFHVECPEFDCIDWTHQGAKLTVEGEEFQVFPSPYSLGCQLCALLTVASTLEELEGVEAHNSILLVRGGLAKEQLMPKNFPFYNPEEHRFIIHLLETKSPQAIVAATSRNPELAGGLYPFPLIEDGDFDIPSVYMTEEEGNRLSKHTGRRVSLVSQTHRIPSTGCNVVARKGASDRRVVLTAHIDCKAGAPGALDNAAGVVVLLLLAELLRDYRGRLGIELVAINGEDYYASLGEIQYLRLNQGKLDQILLNINMDGVGNRQGDTAYSLYQVPQSTIDRIRAAFSLQTGLVEGEPWYQGDHMIFVQNQVPALAITSGSIMNLLAEIAHTPQDRPELVDCARLSELALALNDLIHELSL